MAGGLLQLLATGVQDIFLTHNPQITYFKSSYRRHTNFTIETVQHSVLKCDFGIKNSIKLSATNGDLITKMYIKVKISAVNLSKGEKFAWVKRIGYALLNKVEIIIGGCTVDTQYGVWLDIWHELARSIEHDYGFNKMIGNVSEMTDYNSKSKPEYVIYIPLKFWFNRHYGLSLPLIGLQYQDVIIQFSFNKVEDLIVINSKFKENIKENIRQIKIIEVQLLIDYIFLDTVERRLFALVPHEYLIEQVQFSENNKIIHNKSKQQLQLFFNFPVKELQWFTINGNYVTGKRFLCYTSNPNNWIDTVQECSEKILKNSVYVSLDKDENQEYLHDKLTWEHFCPNSIKKTLNNKIKVINNSNNIVYINTNSLIINDNKINLTDKISGTVTITSCNNICITDVRTEITIRDVSTPVCGMTDTRINSCSDVYVNQFSNYGELIDGTVNPIKSSLLEYNNEERFERRNGNFFNYLQPEMHHSNTPADGINVYSFGFNPEELQPSGTSNFSIIDKIFLSLWFENDVNNENIRNRNKINTNLTVNDNTYIYVFAHNYNIFRVMYGLSGISY